MAEGRAQDREGEWQRDSVFTAHILRALGVKKARPEKLYRFEDPKNTKTRAEVSRDDLNELKRELGE